MANIASCLCGNVRFQVSRFLPTIAHCHCSMCRKFHGAAFSTYAEVNLSALKILSGEDDIQSFHADNGTVRKFCKICGSSLFFESCYNRNDNTIEVALALFDNIEPVEVKAHIFVENKVSWYDISDAIPQFKRFRK